MKMLTCSDSGKALSSRVGKFEVRLVQARDADNDSVCRAYLVDPAGNRTILLEDVRVSIYQGTGEDIFGDGKPSLVLEGFSGGAHCCFTYLVASLGETAMFLSPIENDSPFLFFKDPVDGQFKILADDGAFDYFDGLCHGCSPFPTLVLQIRAGRIVDVSSQFIVEYDSDIAEAKRKISQNALGKFLINHDLATNRDAQLDFMDIRRQVLQIVLSYLNSGREPQAWQTLEEMWPAGDRQRIKKLILLTRAEGLLSKVRKTKMGPMPYTH